MRGDEQSLRLRTVIDREEELVNKNCCGPAIGEPCRPAGKESFGENEIKNTNQAGRQDKVEKWRSGSP